MSPLIVVGMVLFYVLFPVLVIYACQKSPLIDKLGAVIICYIVGIVIGNIGVLPEGSFGVLDLMTTITVPLALPLLLFSINFVRWFRLAGKTALSLLFIIISITIASFVGFMIFKDIIPESWKVAGLMMGVYTGGTPNLAAIKVALDVDPTTYLTVHTADVFISAIHLLFCITIAQRLLHTFLPRFRSLEVVEKVDGMDSENIDNYHGIFKKSVFLPLVGAFGLSALIFAAGGALTMVVPQNAGAAVAILAITTLSIIASFFAKIRNIEKTFQLGMYIILVFCLVVGSMADINQLINTAPAIIGYLFICIFGSMLIHVTLSAIFRIDADTVIVTSVSAICSPPFVGVVAGALKNKEIIVSGLATGLIGYAIGNYLGIFMAYVFHALFP